MSGGRSRSVGTAHCLPRRRSDEELVFVSRPRSDGVLLVVEEWRFALGEGGRVFASEAVERVRSASGSWRDGRALACEEGAPAEVIEQLGEALRRRRAASESGVHRRAGR